MTRLMSKKKKTKEGFKLGIQIPHPDSARASISGLVRQCALAEKNGFDSAKPLLNRNEPAIDWNWGSASPGAEIPPDKLWAHWSGIVVSPETDEYVFHLDADDGTRWVSLRSTHPTMLRL